MYTIKNDAFYALAKQYDANSAHSCVGEVDYHLLGDDQPYAGLKSHREALGFVFARLAEESLADALSYDIDKAQASPLEPQVFFYCPNIVRIDYYGNAFYDAVWKPDDDNFGTTVPYWYALMEPIHGRINTPADFKKVNAVLFPNGTDALDVYDWTTDWSDYFDDGHEWYGASCWSVYDKSLRRYVVMLVSATD